MDIAWLLTSDHVLVVVELLPHVLLLFARLINLVLTYLGMRIHHILIFVNFWRF